MKQECKEKIGNLIDFLVQKQFFFTKIAKSGHKYSYKILIPCSKTHFNKLQKNRLLMKVKKPPNVSHIRKINNDKFDDFLTKKQKSSSFEQIVNKGNNNKEIADKYLELYDIDYSAKKEEKKIEET